MPETSRQSGTDESRPSLGRELKGLLLLYVVMAVFAGVVGLQCVSKPP